MPAFPFDQNAQSAAKRPKARFSPGSSAELLTLFIAAHPLSRSTLPAIFSLCGTEQYSALETLFPTQLWSSLGWLMAMVPPKEACSKLINQSACGGP